MSFSNGLTLTEHVHLFSNGERDFSYTLEDAIVPRATIIAMSMLDMASDIEIKNDLDDIHDLYVNWQGDILKQIATGKYVLSVKNGNTYYETEDYTLIFYLNEDKTKLCYKVEYNPNCPFININCNEELFSFEWDIDQLDSIDAINWDAVQSFDELIGNVQELKCLFTSLETRTETIQEDCHFGDIQNCGL